MPFGLCNAPATFQRLMETALAGLARDSCMVYLDNILVIGRSFNEHLQNLKQVFQRLRHAGLRLKPAKCHLLAQQVEYLGYVVTKHGISADPKKLEAIQSFPVPSDLRSLRSFLGLASYYRRFMPSFSKVANPLFALTKKDMTFEWTPSCQEAFDTLKRLLTEAPVLAFPQFGQGFVLETDASGTGLGAVLAQEQPDGSVRPVAYASSTLQPHERNYGVTELEALGVMWAIKHFRHYLYGSRCDVFTDHEAPKTLLNTPHPSGKLARWGLAIQELDLHTHYRPGGKNQNADALSRYPCGMPDQEQDGILHVAALQPGVAPAKGGEADIAKTQQAEPDLKMMIDFFLHDGTLPEEDKIARTLVLSQSQHTLLDGVLYHVERDGTLRLLPSVDGQQLFREAHAGAFGAHLRDSKVYSQLSRHYWWPGMRRDITAWCQACMTCASRSVGKPVRPPLVPIPVAGAFDRVGVDVIQFPVSRAGNRYGIVFVDYLTKWPEVFPAPDQTAMTIARLLVEQVISRHGVPRELFSDRGAAFLVVPDKRCLSHLGYAQTEHDCVPPPE